jgi:hypothetical protein
MKNIILLDLDGVMITTPSWRKDYIDIDGYSQFNPQTVRNLNKLTSQVNAELWLISARRRGFTLEQFNTFFNFRKIEKELSGMVPVYFEYIPRIEELKSFLEVEPVDNYLIIDDDTSLDGLEDKRFWVKTHPMIGFGEEKLNEALEKIKHWKQ